MCLQDKPEEKWEMDKVRKEINKISNKPLPKRFHFLKEIEVSREDLTKVG